MLMNYHIGRFCSVKTDDLALTIAMMHGPINIRLGLMSVLVPVGQLLDQVADSCLSLVRDPVICFEVTSSGRSNLQVSCEK